MDKSEDNICHNCGKMDDFENKPFPEYDLQEYHKLKAAAIKKASVNKAYMVGYNQVIYNCECGAKCQTLNKYRHFKSVKHLKYKSGDVEFLKNSGKLITCECGSIGVYREKDMKRHLKSKKHLKNMESKNI